MVRGCSVPLCKGGVKHKFPYGPKLKSEWLVAIGRPNFDPKRNAGICEKHFLPNDYVEESSTSGALLIRKRLKSGVVPSVDLGDGVNLSTPPKKPVSDEVVYVDSCPSPEPPQLTRQESDLGVEVLPQDICNESNVDIANGESIACGESVEVEITTEESIGFNLQTVDKCCGPDFIRSHTATTQTIGRLAPYTIRDFMFKPMELHDLTGVESYERFMLIFQSLGPGVHNINYRRVKVRNVRVEDQLFITLWKLRKATTDFELGIHFGTSHTTVSNIFLSFIKFMSEQWGKLDFWPSRVLTDYYMPEGFKKEFPSTRVIVDGTEIKIEKPKNPTAQQATFSTYKNDNTVKIMVGGAPSGLISYCSEAFGGCTSDRQIVERSSLAELCEKGDSVMADRGFNVQDIFAPKSVAVNIPAFLKGKDDLPGTVIMKDRKLASKRVHIERLIGLTKIHKMLRTKLSHCHVAIASEIFFVCVVLSNFKECIVRRKC